MVAEETRNNRGHPKLGGYEAVRPGALKGPRVTIDDALRQKIVAAARDVMLRLQYPVFAQ